MKEETIGVILQSWRKKQGKLISDCANELNAPIEYLEAIENNFFKVLVTRFVGILDLVTKTLVKYKLKQLKKFEV